MIYLKYILSILLGLGSGAIIAGAVFAFIAIIGVVPRMAQKTETIRYIKVYEEAIIIGGIFGTLALAFDFKIYIGPVAVIILSICIGIFYGVLAICLTETLDVIPVFARRIRLKKGIKYFIIALAVGKLIGSLLYFIVNGFFS